MAALTLSRLLRPKSIAVIGGGHWGAAVIAQCRKMGFDGPIWPVHPRADAIEGYRCFRAVDDLPSGPDAVFVGVNRHATIDVVAALSRCGAGGAICFASGFAETADHDAEGRDLQAALLAAAGDMPVIGPNCYGLINYLDGALLWPDQHGGTRVDRGVALIGQSSNVLINLTMQRRGLPLAYVMAAGNQAQIGLSDMAMAVMEDPRVTAIGLHIEGIGDLAAFEAMAARARELGKPIVALKVGRSAAAQAATMSHTASLAGGDTIGRAVLARLGVAVADNLGTFLETLKLLHVHGPLPGRDLCSMSCSGGEASLVADAAEGVDVRFRTLTPQDTARVSGILGERVTVANPLDYHTYIWGDVPAMTDTFAAMMQAEFDLSLLIYDFPRLDRCDDAAWECGVQALTEAVSRTGARAALVASLPENLTEARVAQMIDAGIAPLSGFEDALQAAAAAAGIAEAWALPQPAPGVGARPIRAGNALDEATAKALLAAAGIAVPDGRTASDPVSAGLVAKELGGRLVLKGLGISHKTEVGAVRLNLTPDDVEGHAAAMPSASSFLVERMVEGAIAEVIVGITRDPVYGLAMTVGAGGVLTELLNDTAALPLPATPDEIEHALVGLRISAVLNGWRGGPPVDRAKLIAAIARIADLAVTRADDLIEMDVNPLIATADSAVAVDALIVLEDPE